MMSFAQMLRSEDMGDFHSALNELSTVPKHEGVRLLEQLALEPDVELRCRAVSGMAKIAPERAEALAIQSLTIQTRMCG